MSKNNLVNLTQPIWIEGESYCGKTTRLVEILAHFQQKLNQPLPENDNLNQFILIFCANNRGRILLEEKIINKIKQPLPYQIKTPLAFIIEEVELFFPLIVEKAGIKAEIPLRLRPETEQELATQLWHPQLTSEYVALFGNEYNFVRRCLDLMQLAGCAGIPPEEISNRLQTGLELSIPAEVAQLMGKLILEWRSYCLNQGLLTYGLIYELFHQYLLPLPNYQKYLWQRYLSIFADDVDDYPAISGDIIELFLQQNKFVALTYNQQGKIRLGLNADPDYLIYLKKLCQTETLENSPVTNVFQDIKPLIDDSLANNIYPNPNTTNNFSPIFLIQTRSRAKLLDETAEYIIHAINSREIKPSEIAIIAPGLDEITRFTLIEKFNQAGINAQPLQEQRPLITSPIVRAILTLLGLLFQGLGRLVEQDAVAEMLVILSAPYSYLNIPHPSIDPVRAGLIADHCYHIDPELPQLLPFQQFHRWDRLSYSSVQAYQKIQQWIEHTKTEIKKENLPPLTIIEKIISHFFANSYGLNQIQQSNLREFIETAQHFWQVENRLTSSENHDNLPEQNKILAKFIILLRKGTITANPYPVNLLAEKNFTNNNLTISNIYQYRSFRGYHRWQFWLDIGSYLWSKGGASELFAYQLFLKSWQYKPISLSEQMENEQKRLMRIIKDLSARATEKVFLCHSDLAINGNEQINSPLLTLSNLSTIV